MDTIDCSRTEFIESSVGLMRIAIASGTTTQTVSVEDTISKYYGNLDGTSYCGSRTYTLEHEIEWVSFENDVVTISSVDQLDEEEIKFPRIIVTLDSNDTVTLRDFFPVERYCQDGELCGSDADTTIDPATIESTNVNSMCDSDTGTD